MRHRHAARHQEDGHQIGLEQFAETQELALFGKDDEVLEKRQRGRDEKYGLYVFNIAYSSTRPRRCQFSSPVAVLRTAWLHGGRGGWRRRRGGGGGGGGFCLACGRGRS